MKKKNLLLRRLRNPTCSRSSIHSSASYIITKGKIRDHRESYRTNRGHRGRISYFQNKRHLPQAYLSEAHSLLVLPLAT